MRDYDEAEMPQRDTELAVAARRSRRDEDSSAALTLLDRLDKTLHGTEEALGLLADRLAPVLVPEPPSGVNAPTKQEPRSELAARLDRMCDQAERHRSYLRTLAERIDL
jgi:hypothetical protein